MAHERTSKFANDRCLAVATTVNGKTELVCTTHVPGNEKLQSDINEGRFRAPDREEFQRAATFAEQTTTFHRPNIEEFVDQGPTLLDRLESIGGEAPERRELPFDMEALARMVGQQTAPGSAGGPAPTTSSSGGFDAEDAVKLAIQIAQIAAMFA